ncbi:flagellar hook-length control protein FliK [Bacillus horti]|uniref:Flagellar hook-length control protein FliK n=1 Tax=Caldalkalibacillus horti TaxID=77523 RepID=A0ABT9VUK7_9BACI|nr:flagellar hook-length control protein FliK [Bacillus horti]MDQ0164666.1 flagellar hook-length control protein FliK [Bacillus horti]
MNIAQSFFSTSSAVESALASGVVGTSEKNTSSSGLFSQLFSALTAETGQEESIEGLLEKMLGLLELAALQEEENKSMVQLPVFELSLGQGSDDEATQALSDYLLKLSELLESFPETQMDEESIELNQDFVDQLYHQFLLLPQGFLEAINAQPLADSKDGQQLVAALTKWNSLLQSLVQQQQQGSSTHQAQLSPVQVQQVQQVVEQMNNQPAVLHGLKEKISQVASTINDYAIHADKLIKAPNFVPASILKEASEAQAKQTIAPVPVAQETGQGHSQATQIINTQQDTAIQALQARGMESVTVTKSAEAEQQQTVRFSHLIEDVQKVLKQQIQLKAGLEGNQIRLKLTPEHLGHLDIRLTTVEGKVMAQFLVSSQMAKDALELSVGQLRISLQQQGVQVDRIEITQQQSQQQSLPDQRESQSFAQQHNQSKQKSSYQDDEQSFGEMLETDEVEQQGIDFRA